MKKITSLLITFIMITTCIVYAEAPHNNQFDIYNQYDEVLTLYKDVKGLFPNTRLKEPPSYDEFADNVANSRETEVCTVVKEVYKKSIQDSIYTLYIFEDDSFSLISAEKALTWGGSSDYYQLDNDTWIMRWRMLNTDSYHQVLVTLDVVYNSPSGVYSFASVGSNIYNYVNVILVMPISLYRSGTYGNVMTFHGNPFVMDSYGTGVITYYFGLSLEATLNTSTGQVVNVTQSYGPTY